MKFQNFGNLHMLFLICNLHYVNPSLLRPNVIILFIENVNEILEEYQQLSSSPFKHLADLKKESIQFLNVYGEVSSTSTFASILTGKPAVNIGLIRGKLLPFTSFPSIASSGGLDVNEATLPKALKKCGYHSWFSGYWKMGLGANGDGYPMKHGFDTWMGVSQPHNEWCKPQNSVFNSQNPFNHPYLKLFYRTSFLWILLFISITTLAWFKFISCRSYINLIVYTISTSFAFYVLLHLFMIQKSASCVLYYHDFVFQQPYDMSNLTMHFTQHSAKLIDFVAERKQFFMVLNYLNMKQPHIFSNYFDKDKSRKSKIKSLMELDWSVGILMKKLKKLNAYDKTVVILTGSNVCNHDNLVNTVQAYKRTAKNYYETTTTHFLWEDCFKVPLWIKDVKGRYQGQSQVYNTVSLTDLYETILKSCSCLDEKSKQYSDLFNVDAKDTCPIKMDDGMSRSFGNSPFMVETGRNHSGVGFEEEKESGGKDFIFHYYDVHKPVMVTYKQKYHIIFYQLNKNEELEKLDVPIIINLTSGFDTNILLEEVYENVSAKLTEHMADRQNINLWTSQFEMPVYPWLMPCSNFPRCETDYLRGNDDFTYFSNVTIDI